MKRSLSFLLAAATLASGAFAEEPPVKPAEPPPPPAKQRPPLDEKQAVEVEEHANQTWHRLPLREKLQLLRLHRALHEMDPQDREFIRERIDRYLRMTPAERRQFKANRQRWQQMSPEEKERARQEFRRRHEEFERRWREEHPGEEPPPSAPHSERPDAPPHPEEAHPPPATEKPPINN